MKFFTAVIALAGASSTLALRGVLPNNMKDLLNDKFAAASLSANSGDSDDSGDTCHDFGNTYTVCDGTGSENNCDELYKDWKSDNGVTSTTTCSFSCNWKNKNHLPEGKESDHYCVPNSGDVEEEDMVATPACDICSALYEQTIECENTHQCQKAYEGVSASKCSVTCNYDKDAGKKICAQLLSVEDVDATN